MNNTEISKRGGYPISLPSARLLSSTPNPPSARAVQVHLT